MYHAARNGSVEDLSLAEPDLPIGSTRASTVLVSQTTLRIIRTGSQNYWRVTTAPGHPGARNADRTCSRCLAALAAPFFASPAASFLVVGLLVTRGVTSLFVAPFCRCSVRLVVREHTILPFLALTTLKETAWRVMLSRAILAGLAFPFEMHFANFNVPSISVPARLARLGPFAAFAALFPVFRLGSLSAFLSVVFAFSGVSARTFSLALLVVVALFSGVNPTTTNGPAHLVTVPMESISLDNSPCTTQ